MNDCERRKQDLWWESKEEDSKLEAAIASGIAEQTEVGIIRV